MSRGNSAGARVSSAAPATELQQLPTRSRTHTAELPCSLHVTLRPAQTRFSAFIPPQHQRPGEDAEVQSEKRASLFSFYLPTASVMHTFEIDPLWETRSLGTPDFMHQTSRIPKEKQRTALTLNRLAKDTWALSDCISAKPGEQSPGIPNFQKAEKPIQKSSKAFFQSTPA